MNPQTLSEWELYVKRMAGDTLRSKAIQVNTQRFATMMQGEGYSMSDVEQIVLYFVRQMTAVRMQLPADGAYDLERLARTDPVAKRGITMTEEQADLLAQAVPVEDSDDFESLAK